MRQFITVIVMSVTCLFIASHLYVNNPSDQKEKKGQSCLQNNQQDVL